MSSHMMRGRQLSRDTEHRTAMRRNLVQSLFEHGQVRTTMPKAQEVKSMAERMITLAKTGTLTARRRVIAGLGNDRRMVDEDQEFITEGSRTVVQRLFNDIAPKFAGRDGGYTRIIKTAEWRLGDGGDIVILQLLTEEQIKPTGTVRRAAGLRRKRNERRELFAKRILKKTTAATTAPAADSPVAGSPVADAPAEGGAKLD